ncbi:alkyl sulfatase C-terminal domain-containing protein [Saccharopolyspora shandongensis]|uniref:alkyl sulfatase C-terminal domain-containing protein n=1 Tax=Saccharopolyspora shandongensis TaxID=418495 RepID=UPI0034113D3F
MTAALSTDQVFQGLAVRLDGPRAAAHRLVMRWEFVDTGEVWTVLVGNGVLARCLLDELTVGATTFADCDRGWRGRVGR